MHKSKGLEFPVVFVSCLGKQYNSMDQKGRVLYDREYGMAANIIDTDRRTRKKDVRKNAVATVIKNADRAEAMRLIYVALTRAREKLIVTGCGTEALLGVLRHRPVSLRSLWAWRFSYYSAGNKIQLIITDDMRNRETAHRKEVLVKNGSDEATAEKSIDPVIKKEYEESLYPDYKGRYLNGLYIKTSVSAIKMKHYEESENFHREYEAKEENHKASENEAVPSFALDGNEKTFTNMGAAKGSATHRIMELLDFSKTGEFSGEDRKEYLLNRWL